MGQLKFDRGRHPDDPPLRGSINEYEDFMKSHLWLDMLDWIQERKELVTMELRQAKNYEETRGAQRALDQLDDLANLPEMMIEQLEIEEEDKDNQKDK